MNSKRNVFIYFSRIIRSHAEKVEDEKCEEFVHAAHSTESILSLMWLSTQSLSLTFYITSDLIVNVFYYFLRLLYFFAG